MANTLIGLDYRKEFADDEEGPMPSTRALNSMRAQLTRAQLTPAQLIAATLLSLAIPLMLLPTCPYRPCTPPPPTMPRSANSHPHIFQPNHPARNTLHPRTTHTKHTSPLPALLDGTGLLQMSSKGTSHKVERDRITTKRSHTRDTRKPRKTTQSNVGSITTTYLKNADFFGGS